MKKFLEMNSVPKYTSDGPNMLVMSKWGKRFSSLVTSLTCVETPMST